MNVRLCMPTYNRPDELSHAVDAALRSDIALEVVVVDNSVEHYAQALVGDVATVITLPVSAGLASTWNLVFSMYEDHIVMINDDVAVHTHTVRAMVERAEKEKNSVLFFGAYDEFACFLLRRCAYLDVGPFDPVFRPIYYEDIDMLYRLKLRGYLPVTIFEATFDHVKNATLKALSHDEEVRHWDQFHRNEHYYREKWGGLRDEERFVLPFNGAKPTPGK